VPDAFAVSLALVVALVPVTALPTEPDAVDVSFAFVLARVPTTVVVPCAADVSFVFVRADVPVTVVVPVAVDVSLAFVRADVPTMVVVPDAVLVSFAFVVAEVPETPPPPAADWSSNSSDMATPYRFLRTTITSAAPSHQCVTPFCFARSDFANRSGYTPTQLNAASSKSQVG